MRAWIVIVSVAVHAVLGLAVGAIEEPAEPPPPPIRVTMREAPPEPVPEPEPPMPEPAQAPVEPVARAAPTPPPRAEPRPTPPPPSAAPAPSPVVPDFGVSLGDASGPGVAVAQGSPSGARAEGEPVRREARTLAAAPSAEPAGGGCDEPASRPRPRSMPRPTFPDEAREAGIDGRVRVRITVGPDGVVRDAALVEGLGHGLDEAALEAARQATFEPATRCGEAVEATFTLAVRFTR